MNTGLLTKISAALYLFVEILQQHARAFLTMFCFAYRDAVLQTFKSPNDDTQSCMCKYVDAEEDAASFQEGKSRKQKKRDKKKEKKAASKWSQNERSKTTQCDDSSVGILPSNMTRKYEKKDPGFVLCGTLRLSLSSKLLHENTLTKPFDEAMNLLILLSTAVWPYRESFELVRQHIISIKIQVLKATLVMSILIVTFSLTPRTMHTKAIRQQ
jgi:hypothetical protein